MVSSLPPETAKAETGRVGKEAPEWSENSAIAKVLPLWC
jgi:hypothetical protein